jgi:hypothetical protein
MLHHIRASGDTSQLHRYLIHSLHFLDSKTTSIFWQLQLSIVIQLQTLWNLQMIVAIIIPDNDGCCIRTFMQQLKSAGWCMLLFNDVFFPNLGNSVADRCNVVIGILSSCATLVKPLELKPPLPFPHSLLVLFLWEPFNRLEHSVSLARKDNDFFRQDIKFHATNPPTDAQSEPRIVIKYFLHWHGTNKSTLCGCSVVSSNGLCSPFDAGDNQNMFQHLFGIEFSYENHTHVLGISPIKFAWCFGFYNNLTYHLSHPLCKFALDTAIPSMTSAWIFDQIHAQFVFLCDSNCKIFSPNKWAAPVACIQSFVNDAIGTRLPFHSQWIDAYNNNPACTTICAMVLDPSSIRKATLKDVHYAYRHHLQQSHIVTEDEMHILWEPIRGSTSYVRLQIVPKELHDILFVASHSNLISGHLNAYRTLHHLCLQYHWPELLSYIKQMCQACPGCAPSNSLPGTSSELIYHFPIKASFRVLFVDAYSTGKYSGFEDSKIYLIAACNMMGFSIMEPIPHAKSTNFASGIMKIQLRFGFYQTIVLDKYSKFFGVFKEAVDLLQINCHDLLGNYHNPMLVECVNYYKSDQRSESLALNID